MTIENYFQQAQLSLAAYASLPTGVSDYSASLEAAGMSEFQAEKFVEQWTVVAQYNHTETIPVIDEITGEVTGTIESSNGLSVTVFQDKTTGQKYLAVRGTNDLSDILTDVIDVSLLGTPLFQSQFESLKEQIQTWLDDGTLSGTFTATGHSLGGFLATAAAAEFSEHVAQTYTYNTPGLNGLFGGATHWLLDFLGIETPLDESTVWNIRAGAGISPIAGLGVHIGTLVPIQIENQFNSDVSNPPAALNHSQQTITDALALFAAYSQLSPSLTREQITHLILGSSNANKTTLESCLDALRTVVLGRTAVLASTTSEGDRESFYRNLYQVQGSEAFEGLSGNVECVLLPGRGAQALAADARSEFGSFVALKYGLPLVLRDTTGTHASQLYQQNFSDDYAKWQEDALNPTRRTLGTVHFSDEWIVDRAKLLQAQLTANIKDFDYRNDVNALFVQNGERNPVDFIVKGATAADDYVIRTLPAGLPSQEREGKYLIVFGSEGDDQGERALAGAGGNDRLYGGGGNDQINAGQGDDHLEANTGNDNLLGGAGRDALLGGIGADTLTGGTDSDTLKGGKGNDTYVFETGDGWDWIIDTNGEDRITFDGIELGAGEYIADNVWHMKDEASGKTFTYSLYEHSENNQLIQILAIQGAGVDGGGMWIKGWEPGRFGIRLGTAPQPEEMPGGTATVRVEKSTWYEQDHTIVDGRGKGRATYIAVGAFGEVYGSGQLMGNEFANYLRNGEEDDELHGLGGKDVLIASGGKDKLYGGEGDDALMGGDDDDILDGGNDSDVLAGGASCLSAGRQSADTRDIALSAFHPGQIAARHTRLRGQRLL